MGHNHHVTRHFTTHHIQQPSTRQKNLDQNYESIVASTTQDMSLNNHTGELQRCGNDVQIVLEETSKPHDDRSRVRIDAVGNLLINGTRVVFETQKESPLPAAVAFKLDGAPFRSLNVPMTNILKVRLVQPWLGPNSVEVEFVAIPRSSGGLHMVPGHSRDGTTWKASLFFRQGGAIEFHKMLATKHTEFRERVQRGVQGGVQGGASEEGLPEYDADAPDVSIPPAYVE